MNTTESPANDRIRQQVREHYGRIAEAGGCGCSTTCCTPAAEPSTALTTSDAEAYSRRIGYDAEQTAAVPDGANLGLGCGNPHAIAALQAGQTVLDLGSGAGFDAFLAARAVGPTGHVIGVDMTPSMLAKARENAQKTGLTNTEFRLGEIEHIPVADSSVDVILSNCVINLSPDKARVFAEAARVLKPGGRLAISDVVALQPVPPAMKDDIALYAGCASGAATVAEVEQMLRAAGFQNIRVQPKEENAAVIAGWFPGKGLEKLFASATIEAVKPLRA